MKNIYPKISCDLTGFEAVEKYIKESGGCELQYFHEGNVASDFEICNAICELKKRCPEVREVTVHPPLENYDLEEVLYKDVKIILRQIKSLIQISNKLGIRINLLYHTRWSLVMQRETNYKYLKDLLRLMHDTNVYMLIENCVLLGEERCIVLDMCKEIDDDHLCACIDTCHMHCEANIYKREYEEMLSKYLIKSLCKKYVHQIHFASALNNDGYINHKETHGRKHKSLISLTKEYELLVEYGMKNCNFVAEVSEEDYKSRKDQIKEIEMLNKVMKNK